MNHFNGEIVPINGTEHRGLTKDFFKKINIGTPVLLIREPNNIYDPNAIMVFAKNTHIGYIPKSISNERLTHILDSHREYEAYISSIKSSNKKSIFKIKLKTSPKKLFTPRSKKIESNHNSNWRIKEKPEYFDQDHTEEIIKHKYISGIYKIRCQNGLVYIGQSINIGSRWNQHVTQLDKGFHSNKKLQRDWSRLGSKKFKFELVDELPSEYLDPAEEHYISVFNSFNNGYNATIDGQCLFFGDKIDDSENHLLVPSLQNKSSFKTDMENMIRESELKSHDNYKAELTSSDDLMLEISFLEEKQKELLEQCSDISKKIEYYRSQLKNTRYEIKSSSIEKKQSQTLQNNKKYDDNIKKLEGLKNKFGYYLADFELCNKIINACIKRGDIVSEKAWKHFIEVARSTKKNLISDISETINELNAYSRNRGDKTITLEQSLISAEKKYKQRRINDLHSIFSL